MRLEDEQPPEIHKPGDRIMPDKVSDPQTGISIRFLRSYRIPTPEEQVALDRQFFEALRAQGWRFKLTDADRRFLKRCQILPE